MPSSAIAHTTTEPTSPVPDWMPFPDFPDLAAALEGLSVERAALDVAVQRVIGETAATIQALMDCTATAISQVLDAATITRDLNLDQAGIVLHAIHDARNHNSRPAVGFQPQRANRLGGGL